MLDFFLACTHLDPLAMIRAGGYLGIALIVFAESGLLVGIFLPGDSLLFTAGLLSGAGYLALGPLVATVVVAAVLGDSVGYWFGANVGVHFFKRKNSLFFKQEYVQRTKDFYKQYGVRAVVLARFVPIVRTLAPILAGIGGMRYRSFLASNILGGCLWGAGLILLSFFIGSAIPDSERYVLPISLGIIVLSFLPVLFSLARGDKK